MSIVSVDRFLSIVFVSASFQERGGRGSRLVLCTDGLANVGLGALDDLKGDEQREAAEHFYDQLGIEVRGFSCCRASACAAAASR